MEFSPQALLLNSNKYRQVIFSFIFSTSFSKATACGHLFSFSIAPKKIAFEKNSKILLILSRMTDSVFSIQYLTKLMPAYFQEPSKFEKVFRKWSCSQFQSFMNFNSSIRKLNKWISTTSENNENLRATSGGFRGRKAVSHGRCALHLGNQAAKGFICFRVKHLFKIHGANYEKTIRNGFSRITTKCKVCWESNERSSRTYSTVQNYINFWFFVDKFFHFVLSSLKF